MPAQPSAEIVRVECAKCRRECDWVCARATLCGDRACRVREMQARVRFGLCPRNPLRRSCASSARRVREKQARVRFGPRNAGESASGVMRAQPSAEIVPVARGKCGRECDVSCTRATPCGDRARRVRETQARVRFDRYPRNPRRRSCVSSARNTRMRLGLHAENPLRRSCVSSARARKHLQCLLCVTSCYFVTFSLRQSFSQ